MNEKEYIILKKLIQEKAINQRDLAKETNFSLGKVNYVLDGLQKKEYITSSYNLTLKGNLYLKSHHPQKATILAAGYGLRMVPINTEEPKGLLEVKNEPLIERIINSYKKLVLLIYQLWLAL